MRSAIEPRHLNNVDRQIREAERRVERQLGIVTALDVLGFPTASSLILLAELEAALDRARMSLDEIRRHSSLP